MRTAGKSRVLIVASRLCAVLSIVLCVIWAISQFRCFALLHTRGTLVRAGQIADGQMGAWEYTLTTWSLQTYPHQLRLVRGEYLSIMERDAEKERFAGQLGWGSFSFRTGSITPERRPWFASEPGNWRFLGLGTGETAGSGQISRTFDVPYWLPIVVFGTPLLLGAMHHRRQQRRLCEGRCLYCGYQLDASMTKCPECGTPRADAAPSVR